MSTGKLTGAEIIPVNLRGQDINRLVQYDPKLRRMIERANATLEGNVRAFLEDHCDVVGARDLNTPKADIDLRMKLLDISVRHVRVTRQPELDGIWIFRGNQPLVCFTDPRYRGKRLIINMIRLHRPTVAIEMPRGSA